MARKARVRAKSGVYHVMLQGVRNRKLFVDDEDARQFVDIILRTKEEKPKQEGDKAAKCYTVYAYCLAPVYAHLIIKEEEDSISMSAARIMAAYAHYLNNKYDRDGSVYRGRFFSEPIEDDGRFDIVLRYIHQTPLREQMAEGMDDYLYSSWHEYVGEECDVPAICEIKEEYGKMEVEEIRRLLTSPLPKGTKCLAPKYVQHRPSDQKVMEDIRRLTGATNVAEYQMLTTELARQTLIELRKTGASIRQLERLTGYGRGVIQGL